MTVALVTGAGGQLATELVRASARYASVSKRVHALSIDELDITSLAQVESVFERLKPSIVLNAAAYTAVDAAEQDAAAASLLNTTAVSHLAQACCRFNAKLVHVSTDYVFDGSSSAPYATDAVTAPQSVYGHSKRAGELAALANSDSLVVRTAWLYAAQGKNFMKTMIALMESRPEIRVVCDQVGTPTHAAGLADALWALAERGACGVHHWTDAGIASWYEFALAIRDEAAAAGFTTAAAHVKPIATSEYPTAACRPMRSVLEKSRTWRELGRPAPHWREGLRTTVREYARSRTS